ncbi:MAG: C39 family peptidase [Candidatus Sericytochromatia bacterium]
MAINFNDPTLNRVFDLNGDGKVTKREVNKLLKADGNKNDLSAQDLQSIGITDTGLQQEIIEKYKSHTSSTNSVSFGKPDTQANNNVSNNAERKNNFLSNVFGGLFKPSNGTNNTNTNNAVNTNNQPVDDGFLKFNGNVRDFHLTQFTGAPSEKGDCGPTSGAMVLKAFGIDASVADVRNASGVTKPRNGGKWALGTNEIANSIEKLSNGQITQSGQTKSYPPNADGKDKLVADIRAKLQSGELPILCTGTENSAYGSRHYVVVTGVNDNGELQIADPARAIANPDGTYGNGAGAVTIKPEELLIRMQNAKAIGKPTELMSFKNNNSSATNNNASGVSTNNNNSSQPVNTPANETVNAGSNGPGDSNDWKKDFDDVVGNTGGYVNGTSREVNNFKPSELTDPKAKEIYDLLGKNKEVGHYLSKLLKEHPDQAADICDNLKSYLSDNSGSLFDPKLKEKFAKDILHDIAYPTDIHQEQKGTCSVTSSQVKLALENPKKYVELATDLAQGKSWNGIKPNTQFEVGGGLFGGDTRTLSAKVVQNALMDYGKGDAAGDWGSRKEDKDIRDGGLTQAELERVQEKLFGKTDVKTKTANNEAEIFSKIDANLAKGNRVPFSVSGVGSDGKPVGHEMLILSKEENGFYKVFTWGKEVLVSEADLKQQLITAQLSN